MAPLVFDAADRNKAPIADVLQNFLPKQGRVLEIASGSGQHIAHFAKTFPKLTWVPSEPDPERRQSISQYIKRENLTNVESPLEIDVLDLPWPIEQANFVYNANMIHISSPNTTPAVFQGASAILSSGEFFLLYGPFKFGVDTAPSNLDFDSFLKSKNPEYGVKEFTYVVEVAKTAGMEHKEKIAMPANNHCLLFEKS